MHMNLQTYRYTDTGAYIITHTYRKKTKKYACLCTYSHTHVKVSVVFVISSHVTRRESCSKAPRGQHGNWRDHCGIDELRPGSLGCRHHLLLCLCLRDFEKPVAGRLW